MSAIAELSVEEDLRPLRERLEKLITANMSGRSEPYWLTQDIAMAQSCEPLPPTSYIYEPSICICVRGRKTVLFGNETFQYDENHYLLTCVDIPTIVSVAKASEHHPYSGMLIRLDLTVLRSLIAEMEIAPFAVDGAQSGVGIWPLDKTLLEAICRLAELSLTKKDLPFLAPHIMREILYRLLSGPSGDRLRAIAQYGSQTNRVAKAVDFVRRNFARKMAIEELAEMAGMGVSTFHRKFLDLTTMSPIQYQKHLRLHEARRLMLLEDADAASSAIEVGYESVSQFNREYRRLFGAPPALDKKQLLREGRLVETIV